MTAAEPCPGQCNRRYREAQDTYRAALAAYDPLDPDQERPEPPAAVPWAGEPVWCGDCTTRIRLRLAQLDTLAGILAATADGHRPATSTDRVSGTAGHPSPSQAADDLDEMHAMLAGWESGYRDYKHWSSGPPRGELASRETECVEFLLRHLTGILAWPDGAADFGREVLQWHREVAASAKAGPPRALRMPMRCPSCQMLLLTWTEGTDRVDCACGLVMSYAEYEAAVERITSGDTHAA